MKKLYNKLDTLLNRVFAVTTKMNIIEFNRSSDPEEVHDDGIQLLSLAEKLRVHAVELKALANQLILIKKG